MRFTDTVKLVTRNLRRRKGRTILTAIGVTIGTAAIVAMMSLTIGLKENVVKSVSKLGNFSEIEVFPGYYGENVRNAPQLNKKTIDQIKLIPGVTAVMPRVRYNSGQVELQAGRKAAYVEIVGVDMKEGEAFHYQMAAGRYLGGRNQAVISNNVSDMLTLKKKQVRQKKGPDQNQAVVSIVPPSSELTKVFRPNLIDKDVSLTISKMTESGVLETKQFRVTVVGELSSRSYMWGGGTVYLPIEIVREMNHWTGGSRNSFSRTNEEVFDALVVKVPGREQVEEVVNQLRYMGLNAISPASQLQEVNKVFLVVQVVLGGIGAVSLLVATIGIINTMVMSILERTREIGIMKVLGATIPNIRYLFLIEAGAIGFIGGVAGLIISYMTAGIINFIFRIIAGKEPNWGTIDHIAVIPFWLAFSALAFASVVGVLAGIYPALRAARLSPLNAIRQE